MSAQDFSVLLPTLLLTGWACVLVLVDAFVPGKGKGFTAVLAALGLTVTAGATLRQFGMQAQAFSGMVIADGFSQLLTLLFLGAGLVGIALAYDYIRRRGIERGEYYTMLLFTVSGMILMAQAVDLIVVFLALELLSLPLYVLAGIARPEVKSEEAAMKYFLLGAFASGFVVYGIALVYGAAGSNQFNALVRTLSAGGGQPALLTVGASMIMVGLGFKVAVVPFHMWTPDVYDGAPSSVTAFMSVGAKAAGFAALLRVFLVIFPGVAQVWAPLTMWIAALTMTWGNVAAIAQRNIKRMLAYSSIAHAGYILMALPAAAAPGVAPSAISAALFYLIVYAISNLGAWGVVVALERSDGAGLQLSDYAGLGARKPWLALAMALFMLSLTGVPPTAGFIGKFYIFRAALDADLIWLALVGVITSLISAYYYLRVVIVMYMQAGEPQVRSESWLDTTVGLTAIATFLLGVLPGPLLLLADHVGQFNVLP